MVKMNVLLKNQILEKVKQKEGLTDQELLKLLTKDDVEILEDQFNKTLLDLEILGLITVSWLTKNTKSIELVKFKEEEDEYDKQIQDTEDKDYEASFPSAE
jgi:hypothetical protein|tara:strand:+ start:2219 stop:2521 length:303 start_codon:yes stop_codon:yes gene_type:complete